VTELGQLDIPVVGRTGQAIGQANRTGRMFFSFQAKQDRKNAQAERDRQNGTGRTGHD
jgi:hypothetical protein